MLKRHSFSINSTIFQLMAFLWLFSSFAHAQNYAKATVVMESYKVNYDNNIKLGLLVNLERDWHLYWKNSGDSGIPTSIQLSLPNGFSSYKVFFPIPKSFEFDGLVSYGYENQVMFTIEVDLPERTELKDHVVGIKLKSLICKDICIPFDTVIQFTIDLSKDYVAPVSVSNLFNQNENYLPAKSNNLKASAILNKDKVSLRLSGLSPDDRAVKSIYFFPYENGYFLNATQQKINWADDYVELLLEPEPFRTKVPEDINGIIVFENTEKRFAYEIQVPIGNKLTNQ